MFAWAALNLPKTTKKSTKKAIALLNDTGGF